MNFKLKKIERIVKKINDFDKNMQELSDEDLKAKTAEFKEKIEKGTKLEMLLPEAFAVAREAAFRVLGMKPYDVQLMGGIALFYGDIAEQKTGEGKTLTAVAPCYLIALAGKGVHVVTVNDYLAKRDAEQMGKVHEFLGLTVGCILNQMNPDERRKQYACDITYVTNNELGFDYLRDNMAIYKNQLVQRGLYYAIIDEADSVLIDEARTPLIISGQSGKSTKLYTACDVFVKQLTRGEGDDELSKLDAISGESVQEDGDFLVNEKDKIVRLTEEGTKKTEKYFGIKNLADPENLEIRHNIILALRAHSLMKKDKDYVVKEGEVLIVDEFTGRIMPGRRYSDGLHQAIEAKEGVEIKRESVTNATITFQNLFNKYERKGGMTGTGITERKEFRDIYGMDVVQIPTNKPVIRKDKEDLIFKTQKDKYCAVLKDVLDAHKKGQPVLIGTANIETSETLSRMLRKMKIRHNVLNAKEFEREADIVADAGQYGAVTIATNMAGRGTDIKLDERAKAAGGLKIIGTERNDARRIDDQLRGRAGRQGDPGESRFYISLEDDLMRLFGKDNLRASFEKMGVKDGEALDSKMLSKAVRNAQKRIESNNYGIRKNVLDYDMVMNEQREIIYAERRKVLNGENVRDMVMRMLDDLIDQLVDKYLPDAKKGWDRSGLSEELANVFPDFNLTVIKGAGTAKAYKKILKKYAKKSYEIKEEECQRTEYMRELERVYFLRINDAKWMDHIDAMDKLRQGAHLQAYGQKDPVTVYREQAYNRFDKMMFEIEKELITMLMHTKFETKD